jgi:hypothetical protein
MCFQQTAMVSYFSQSKGQGLAKSIFVAHHFFERFLYNKKKDIALAGTFGLFFASCISTFPIISLLIFSKKIVIIE